MQYRRLGKAGLKVSELSLGSWVTFHNQVDYDKAKHLMTVAYDAGVNFFDNAEAYANGQAEVIMGKVLRDTQWGRDTYIVSSKVFWGGQRATQRGLSRKHVRDACDAALKRLGVDYLDLYYCHRPDPTTPVEETVRAMHELIMQGKVLYWGTSEWSAQQIFEAHGLAREFHLTPPSMEQPQYNMFHRERFEAEYARVFSELGYGSTIWSPLASGILSGKYNLGIPPESRMTLKGYEWLRGELESPEGQMRIMKVRELEKLTRELGMSMSQMAIVFCLKNKNVSSVILGASRPEQLMETLKATDLQDRMDDKVMDVIEGILQNKPIDPNAPM
ncbi:MAG TPA: aldo/keto reductase [Oligoflexus sp.]|uniref:potassium channel beta subunit family protein n=1 Tax=Oligoflexus sp. TaxID=1971216 RepID=UPI002D80924D|nr:aldo/keto reductase [Oligoflexus sp.]HET9237953.1 aldo/keto reductase [Oligoflexus sp.]